MTEVTEIAALTESAREASPRKRTATRTTRSETTAETTPAAARRRARRAASSSKAGRDTGKSSATSGEPTPPQRAETISTKPTNPSKQTIVLMLLKRPDGATIDELMEATGWQAHSVRGFLSAVVRKKLSLTLISDVVGNGIRRYRIAEAEHEPGASPAGAGDDTAPPAEEVSPVPIAEALIGTAA